MLLGKSDIKLNGTVSNFLPYYLHEQTLYVNSHMVSPPSRSHMNCYHDLPEPRKRKSIVWVFGTSCGLVGTVSRHGSRRRHDVL